MSEQQLEEFEKRYRSWAKPFALWIAGSILGEKNGFVKNMMRMVALPPAIVTMFIPWPIKNRLLFRNADEQTLKVARMWPISMAETPESIDRKSRPRPSMKEEKERYMRR